MANNSQVNIGIKFKTDSKEVEASLSKLKKSLLDIQKIKPGNFSGTKRLLDEIKETASKVEQAMEKAFNPTLNTTNITTFKSSLKDSGLTVNQVKSDFSKLGVLGEVAFNRMTSSLLTTNLQLKLTSKFLSDMGDTMVKTVKWGIASSIMNSFSSSVQGAFSYVQSLEKSLTNIRIVTGDSTLKMAQFADQANKSAQALGRSTLDYTKASLTFYQQGLNDLDVQARTEATLKAQNITGAGQEMADYLTSVWNGYKVANEEAELYVDKLAAVADSSASDMSELAIAMSKVASTAHTMGVDVDQLNGMIATVVATTRQAPEAVGTAFKTIFSRMNDIQAGAEDAEISLGNYSGKMALLGFNVLDATGHLRDTGLVMEEIGDRWLSLTKEQQIYLAQTMGGQRQVNQLMALFDNWTTYSELLNTSLEALGTLAQKNSVYMESLGAKMEQLGAAGERVKDALINSDSFKTMIEGLTGVTNLVGNLFETMGNGNVVLLTFGSALTQLFSGTIAKEISNVITNMNNAKANAEILRNLLEMTEAIQKVGQGTQGGNLVADRMAEIQQYYSVMDLGSINVQKNLIAERGLLLNQIKILEADRKAAQELQEALSNSKVDQKDWKEATNNFIELNAALSDVKQSLTLVNKLKAKDLFEDIFDPNQEGAQKNFTDAFNEFVNNYKSIDPTKAEGLRKLFEDFTTGQISGGAFWRGLNEGLDEADAAAKRLTNTLENNNKQLENSVNRAKQLDGALDSNVQHAKQLFDVTNVVKMVSAIGQISSTLITIKNLKSIWDDKDISTGEKIAKTVSSIAFIVPTLVNSVKTLRASTAAIIKEQAIRVAHLKMISLELERQNAALAYQKGLISLDKYKLSYNAVMKAKKEYDEFSSKAAKGLPLLSSGLTGILGTLGSILPILLAIGAAVGVIYLAYKEWNKLADAAKRASQAAADAKKAFDDLKTSIQDVKSAIEDLRSSESNLDNLTKGTQEWRDALQLCNDKVLDLITKYPELAQYVDNVNGKLTLTQEGLAQYLALQQAKLLTARNASYIAASESRNANATAAAALIGHNSLYQLTSLRNDYIYAGAKVSETSSKYSSAEEVMKVVTSLNELIDRGEVKLSDDFTKLADVISEETGLSKEQTSAILSNQEALVQLRGQLLQNLIANRLVYEGMAANGLQDNNAFKNADLLGQQIISSIAGADLLSRVKELTELLKTEMTKGVAIWSGANNKNVKDIRDRFNDAQGTNWQLASNAVRGTDTNRSFAFLDEEGKVREFTALQIASTIAAKLALLNLSGSAETASKVLSGIEKNTNESNNEAVKQWVAGLNMTAINQEGLKSLSTDITEVLGTEGAKSLAEARNTTVESLQTEWNLALNDLGEKFKTVAEGASLSVQKAFADIQNKEGLKNATLDFQQMVVEDLRSALTNGGKAALDSLKDFYGKVEDFDKLEKATASVDLTKGAEGLALALLEAGIQTKFSKDELLAWILAQQGITENLSPELIYKSIHDITDKLKKGDTIDSLQADILKNAGVNLDAFFRRAGDGTLELKTNALTFQKYVDGISLLSFRAKIAELLNNINGINTFQASQYSSDNSTLEDFSSEAVTDTGEQDTEKLQAQLLYLEIIGVKNEEIGNAQAKLSENLELLKTLRLLIARLVQENGYQYQNLSLIQKGYLELIKTLKELVASITDPGLDADVDESKWEALTEHIQKYAEANDELADELSKNVLAAEDVAEAILRYDSAVSKVQKNYKNWMLALSSGAMLDLAVAAELLENVYSDLLDLPFENTLSNAFLTDVDNLNLLKLAANGSELAYNQLALAAKQDIMTRIGINDESLAKFNTDLSTVESQINEGIDDLLIGAFVDDTQAIQAMNELINAAEMTADEATDLLASMGVDADVESIQVPETQEQGIIDAEPHITYKDVDVPSVVQDETGSGTVKTTSVQVPTIDYEPIADTATQEGQKMTTVLRVKSARKSSGGKFKHKNSTAGNNGGGGKGKSGKGGGGGKGKLPNKAKKLSKTPDRYRNNTVKANKLTNQMTKLQKEAERLDGKNRIKNLTLQLKILQKQNDVITERIKLQTELQNELAAKLKKYGATFDKDKTLNNYEKTFNNIINTYNKAVEKWNSVDAKWQEENKDFLNNAKLEMDQALANLSRYDALQQEKAKEIQNRIDNAQEQINNKVQQFELKIKATLDLSQAKRDWNEFKRDVLKQVREDDIIGQNRFRFMDLSTYYNNDKTGSLQRLQKRLTDLTKNNKIFSTTYDASVSGKKRNEQELVDYQARMEEIKKVLDDFKDLMGDWNLLIKEIKDSIFDAIDVAQDAFDEQMDEYEFIGDILDHNLKVISMLYGDEAYDQMAKYYERIEQNNNNTLDFLSRLKLLWYGRMMEELARMNELAKTEGTDSNLYKEAQDRFEEYKKHWMDSVNDLNSAIENALDNIIKKYQNSVHIILQDFEKGLTGGHSLDDVADDWDMLNEKADMYLDKINAAYETLKLRDAYEDAIRDNEGDIAAQQSLNDLMEQQLAYLRDKDKLTQYDVDRANALLQIEIKRLALEQSRSNKNRLRLRKDSQGNYTYQYTADTLAINKAEQELADAQNSLYNSDKSAYVNNLSGILKSAENIKQKLEDIWTDEHTSLEDKLKKTYELYKYYGEQVNDLLAENATIRNNLMLSSFKQLVKLKGYTEEQLNAMTQLERDALFKELIPQADSMTAAMVLNIKGSGGFEAFFEAIVEPLRANWEKYEKSKVDLQNSAKENFDDLANGQSKVADQAERLTEDNKKLVKTFDDELKAVQSVVNEMNKLNRVFTVYGKLLEETQNKVIASDAGIIDSSLKTENTASKNAEKQYNTLASKKNSAADLGEDYVPYAQEWNDITYASMYASSGIDEEGFLTGGNLGLKGLREAALTETTKYNNFLQKYSSSVPLDIDKTLYNFDKEVLQINNLLNMIYESNEKFFKENLAKHDELKESIVNQDIHIDADFPNATQVSEIIQAIETLPLRMAQYANRK